MLGLNFLVANQIDPAIEELSARRRGRRRSARDPPDSRQPVSGEGSGRPRHPGAPEPAAARRICASSSTPTCCSASGSTTSAADSSIARSRRSPKCSGSIRTTIRVDESREAVRRAAPVGRRVRDAAEARRARDGRRPRRGTSEILAFLENELGLDALKRMDYPEAARRFDAAIDLDQRTRPHISISATCGSIKETRRRGRRVGTADRQVARARLSGIRAAGARLSQDRRGRSAFRTLCRRLIAANPQDWRARLALARHLSTHGNGAQTRWSSCSKRWSTIRTRSRCTRRSGRHCRSCSCRRRSSARYVDSRETPSSTSIRTCACAAATAAPSYCGSARTVTSGTHSWRSGSPRRRTPRRRSAAESSARVSFLPLLRNHRHVVELTRRLASRL